MYIPIMKNRLYENKFIRDYSYLFDENIIPMIEIIQTKIGRTNKSIYEILEFYQDILENEFFVDLFTFSSEKYKPFSPTSVSYAMKLRDNYTEYVQDLDEFKHFHNAIPVISVKDGRDFEEYNIVNLIVDLKSNNRKIAIRLESTYFEDVTAKVLSYLDESDYIMLDINEDDINSKFMEMEYFEETQFNCKTIILCSPRHRVLKNGSYSDQMLTELIDLSLLNDYDKFGFDGYGDYGNLKDVLPNDGGNGKGAALGLFYLKSSNQVYSILNSDTTLGARGHKYVVETLMEEKTRNFLDRNRDCLMYKFIENEFIPSDKYGNFGQWKYITLLRTISEIKK